MRRLARIHTVAVTVVVLGTGCGSDGATEIGSAATSSDGEGDTGGEEYCTEVERLTSVLDDGGSMAEYDISLARVLDAGPPDHEAAWRLLLTASREPFDYANFDPAVDALDEMFPDLVSTCPGARDLIVDDDGRVRSLQPD